MTRTSRHVLIVGIILLISLTGVKVSNPFTTSVSATASPDFSIAVNPGSLSIVAGYSGNATVLLTSLNGFSGAVTLSSSRVGTCCNASLNPATLTLTSGGTANSTLSISTFSYMGWGGPGPVNVTGTNGVLTHLARLSLTINQPYRSEDFQISVNPSLVTVTAGDNNLNVSTILVTSIGHLTTLVWFWEQATPAPRGYLDLFFSPDYVVPAPGATAEGYATLYSNLAIAPGTYLVNLTAYTSPKIDGFSAGPHHTVWLTVVVKPAPLSLALEWAIFSIYLPQVINIGISSVLGLILLWIVVGHFRKRKTKSGLQTQAFDKF